MDARPSVLRPRTLALCALVTALLLPPAAGAATPQGPIPAASGTVDQQDTTAPVTQPVRTAVDQTTARVTQPVAQAVENTATGVTRQVEPVADDAGETVAAVTSGAARRARDTVAAATPTSGAHPPAAPAAAPAREHIEGPARSLRRRTAGLGSGRAQGHSAGAPHRDNARTSASAGAPVAAAPAPLAPRLPAAGPAHGNGQGGDGSGTGAPAPELPAAASGSASALSTGLGLGGLALLAGALCLAAPALLRPDSALPASPRPVLFVSALERPG
jgi:hypothetical protein